MTENYKDFSAKLIGIEKRREDVFELILYSPEISELANPGQFLMIRVGQHYLRRPMSIFNINDKDVHLLVRKAGKGTETLLKGQSGETLQVLGPLGNGFPLPNGEVQPLLVAGGMGIAPLYFLYVKLVSMKLTPIFFYGENTSGDTCLSHVIPCNMKIATGDGLIGFKGHVTDMLENYIAGNNGKKFLIYACGPEGMYESMSKIEALKGLEVYVSVEENMACGIGACLGCSVLTKDGYKRVCKDGPVFKLSEIV